MSRGAATRLRVLHLNLAAGGIEQFGVAYGRALADSCQVEALSVFNDSVRRSEVLAPIVEGYLHEALPSSTGLGRLRSIVTVLRLARRFRPHLIHDSAGTASRSGMMMWPFLRRIAPLLLTIHDPFPPQGWGRTIATRLSLWTALRETSGYFVVGPRCRDALVALGVEADRVAVQRIGSFEFVAGPASREVTRKPGQVLFFGALRPNKGLGLLIRVAEKVCEKRPDAVFVVAGRSALGADIRSTGWPAELSKILADMRQRSYFRVVEGRIPDGEVPGHFLASEVTIVPYTDATSSAIPMLAIPLGSAVVSTDVGDLGFLIGSGRAGILCRPDADSLAAGVLKVLGDQSFRLSLVSRARSFVETECSWDRIVLGNMDLYRHAIGD